MTYDDIVDRINNSALEGHKGAKITEHNGNPVIQVPIHPHTEHYSSANSIVFLFNTEEGHLAESPSEADMWRITPGVRAGDLTRAKFAGSLNRIITILEEEYL